MVARPETEHTIGGAHPRALSSRRWKTTFQHIKLGRLFPQISGQSKGTTTGYLSCRSESLSPAAPKFFGRAARRVAPQSGRSMIEMLAVLAIIGILSVAAVAGLMWAFAKHKANDTIHDVYLWELAALDSNQLFDKASGQLILSELGSVSTHGYPMAIWIESEDAFSIHVNDVPKRVCSLMLDMVTADQIVTVNDVLFESADICDAETNLMIFYLSKDQGAIDQACIPACSGCQSCREGTCYDNNALCGTNEICSSGTCACAPGAIECQGSCYVCPEGYSLDTLTCSCTCDPQECPENATWNSLTCSCECIEGYDMCNNTCHPQCNGSGMTGERDPDTCACICLEGTNADTCACPEGYIYVDGQCQKFECRGGPTEYICYINDKRCGYGCTATGNVCRVGACYPSYCNQVGTFSIKDYWGGYGGCEYETTFCAPWETGDWYCFDTKTQQPCCDAYEPNFNTCYHGSCIDPCKPYDNINPSYGHANFTLVTDRHKGCFFDNGIRCLLSSQKWTCYINDYFLECGNGCSSPINCGNCSPTYCPTGSYWDEQKKQCCTKDGNSEICCGRDAQCFRDGKVCGVRCAEIGKKCSLGLCYDPGCPEGFTFDHNGFYFGCKQGEILMTQALQGEGPYVCFYQNDAGAKYCTDLTGENCGEIYLDVCSYKKICPYASLITEDCRCAANPNGQIGDYCCPPNHTYLNGGCTLINCPEGQTPDENGICKTACENNDEVLNCVCDGTIYTNVFNAKICCESGYTWNENTQTCQ